MRCPLVVAAIVLPFGCTEPNPAFNLEERADAAIPEGGDDHGDSSTSDASESTQGDATETAGEDDHHGGEASDDTSSDSSNDTSSGSSCGLGDCAPHEYCAFPQDSSCGFDEPLLGVCTPRPESCPPERDPVLACDCNTYYDNPCLARMDGFDIVCRPDEDGCACK
jgi:hypothetical protein